MKKILIVLLLLNVIPSFAMAETNLGFLLPPLVGAEEVPSDRDGDGIEDSSDLYPDDPTNTPPDTEKPVVSSNLAEGTYTESQQVTLSANEPATIYYTLDGSVPTESSTVYTNPILIDKTTTLKYFGKDAAENKSDVVSQTFRIEVPSDRDSDGVPDSSDLYPDDPTNTPPAPDETSEAEKRTQSILIMVLGVALTALVLGGKGIL